jgi:hypothetical protein
VNAIEGMGKLPIKARELSFKEESISKTLAPQKDERILEVTKAKSRFRIGPSSIKDLREDLIAMVKGLW